MKYLNLNTDNTLGGDNSSDSVISSQKAVKDYVDTTKQSKLTSSNAGTDIGIDIVDGIPIIKFTNDSGYVKSSDLGGIVTLTTDQNISGVKTFIGSKRIKFQQYTASDKLGFTLYNNSAGEIGYLEFNPTNKIDGAPVMTLGNYATSASDITQVGFRRYSSVSGASGAYNLLTPLIADARSPFNLTTTYTNFYLPLGVTNGETTVTTAKSGLLDISSFLSSFVTSSDLLSYATKDWVGQQDYIILSDLSIASGSSNYLNYNNGTGQFSINVDTSVTTSSSNLITSGAVATQLSNKQDNITSSNKLSSDLVDDTNKTHKFATADQLSQISTNTTDISAIKGKIPSEASSSNQLADKAFVTDIVHTNTANFRGNWSNWSSVPSSSNSYPEDYTGSKVPTVNDYMVVGDASDYTSATLEGAWRFKYTGVWSTSGKSGWIPEYQVNETPMTTAQLAAINSGITADKVAKIVDVGNGTITFTQGGVTKGTISTNQSNNTTIALDAGGSTQFITVESDTGGAVVLDIGDRTITDTQGDIVINSDDDIISFSTVALTGSYNDLINKPTVDQVFNGYSTNAQSGTAIKSVLDDKASSTLSNVSSIDSNSAVQTALDSKVSKSGDTMTGDLTIRYSNMDLSTLPETNIYQGIALQDVNGECIAKYEGFVTTAGDYGVAIGTKKYGEALYNTIIIGYDSAGNPYTQARTPSNSDNSTNIATTAFVRTLINSAFSYDSSTQTLTLGV